MELLWTDRRAGIGKVGGKESKECRWDECLYIGSRLIPTRYPFSNTEVCTESPGQH